MDKNMRGKFTTVIRENQLNIVKNQLRLMK